MRVAFRWVPVVASFALGSALARPLAAFDKQGSAHGGAPAPPDADGFDVSGSVSLGAALYNPTYAARPDNTGLTLFRYATHVDVDLVGPKLSVPLDLNMFTDRERQGAAIFLPSELDVIAGLTTTWDLRAGASLEVGSRVEHDRAVDRAGATQTYVDIRSRLVNSFAQVWPGLGRVLHDGDVSGWVTLGVFAYNPSYFARPDNTGKAFLRYGPHVEVSVLGDLLSFGLDATMFTDRETSIIRPSELDLTPEIIGHVSDFELHLAYERDMPVDQGGLVQDWLYVLLVYDFDVNSSVKKPMEQRGYIPSP